jgi:hypothetical protein
MRVLGTRAPGGGYFVLDAVAQSIDQEIEISVAQLAQLSYQSGSVADTLWVHASDGTQTVLNATGPWSSTRSRVDSRRLLRQCSNRREAVREVGFARREHGGSQPAIISGSRGNERQEHHPHRGTWPCCGSAG